MIYFLDIMIENYGKPMKIVKIIEETKSINTNIKNAYIDFSKMTLSLVAIVSEFYRCTNCGSDTRQHVNGSIRYIKLSESDKAYIKSNGEKI